MVEGDGNVTQRSVAAHDGEAEDRRERKDLQKLAAREDVLTRHDAGDVDDGGAVGGAGEHVRHGQEDRVAEAVVEEEVLVQEEDSYVGAEPGGDYRRREDGGRYCRRGEEERFSVGGGGGVWRCSGDVDDCWCGGGGGVEPRVAHPPRRP